MEGAAADIQYFLQGPDLKKLNEYLTDFPELEKHPFAPAYLPPDWPAFDIQTQKILENGRNGYPIKSGEDAAKNS